jgi:hypothetical protein
MELRRDATKPRRADEHSREDLTNDERETKGTSDLTQEARDAQEHRE